MFVAVIPLLHYGMQKDNFNFSRFPNLISGLQLCIAQLTSAFFLSSTLGGNFRSNNDRITDMSIYIVISFRCLHFSTYNTAFMI